MKKLFLFLLGFASLSIVALAQEEDPGKALKKAQRNIASYYLDPAANAEKLTEAISMMDMVVQDSEFKRSSKAWLNYGKVYNEVVNQDVRAIVLNPEHKLSDPSASLKSYEGYSKAFKYAEKGYEKKDALAGLSESVGNINYYGSLHFKNGDYKAAFENFEAVLGAHKTLTKNGEDGAFGSEEEVQDQNYFAGLAAVNANMNEEAKKYFEKLMEQKYDSPAMYESLFKVYQSEGNAEKALEILGSGREIYPEDAGLLFAEINYALQVGKLDELITKLEEAKRIDPKNTSVVVTLGNVYDQLYQKALDAEDFELAETQFANAQNEYNSALEIDPENFDAIYSLGALEYNKAAYLSSEVNALADDYSKEGTKKWEAKREEMMAQFDIALPYFQKAETLRPDDMNTIIALKEIYVRKDLFDLSNEYKAKLEKLQQEQE